MSVIAAAAVVGLGLTGCTSTNSDDDSSLLETLQDRGSVTVGFAGEAPYSFEENGELTGATVALHREIFGNLGIDTVEGVNADFGALIPGLQANRFDVVSAGMSILPERCEQAAFSEPEFNYTTALMVEEGNPMNLTDMQSVAESGARLATMTGAIESDYASELGIDSMQVATPQDGMDAVTSGRADVFALTGISLNWMKNNDPDAPVEVTESFVASRRSARAVPCSALTTRSSSTPTTRNWPRSPPIRRSTSPSSASSGSPRRNSPTPR
mgnify:CR=1 FL=1